VFIVREKNKTTNPRQIGFFSTNTVMFQANFVTNLLKQVRLTLLTNVVKS